jgi:hypothetical protein
MNSPPASEEAVTATPRRRWPRVLYRIVDNATWLGVIAGGLAAVLSTGVFFSSERLDMAKEVSLQASYALVRLREVQERALKVAEHAEDRAHLMEMQLEKTQSELAELSARVIAPKTGEASAKLVKQLASMQTAVERAIAKTEAVDKRSGSVGQRLAKIEGVILADPQKALDFRC